MYAITGITGKVGGALARTLLANGKAVRAIVRDQAKGVSWAALGCEVALAEMEDAKALSAAFAGTEAVFILPPSEFDPEPGYPEAQKVIGSVVAALKTAGPKKVLCLSTIGADAKEDNLLSQRTMLENALNELDLPVTFLRPAWFMENALWDVGTARDTGILYSFLQPADKKFPMIATKDIGILAGELIQQDWTGKRVVELEAAQRASPDDLAHAFEVALKRPVKVEVVNRETWEDLFRSQGMKNPTPRIRMLDGFNESWIEFKDSGRLAKKGNTSLQQVVDALVAGDNTDDRA
ncbi:NmrA family NAD(P)-binding protein [Rhizobium laguerreae]|uniref:NmrA family NAD(P)-binding protein n=1 Tax=Rhizobium laguerreae TaxID=1076926 RepID=A0AB35FDI3_9HYPH|nr:NmrA family NAD(P)-binding protein [Rhizobium laguerreae]MBY3064767.1 NmrA family NAD(P)-binding protein [Rhizobium laguerreae]